MSVVETIAPAACLSPATIVFVRMAVPVISATPPLPNAPVPLALIVTLVTLRAPLVAMPLLWCG